MAQDPESLASVAADAPDPLQLMELIHENVRDYAIFTTDTDGRVSTWNIGAERLLGYRQEEILGHRCDRIFTPEDRLAGGPEQERETAARTGRSEDERWHVRKDGSRFWGSGIMTSLRDETGRLRGFVKILRDFTQRKLAEEELRAINVRLQQAMRETHHRVKNNLQIIASMIDMQLMEEGSAIPPEDLKRLVAHIQSLAAVHDVLTQEADAAHDVYLVSTKAILEKLIPVARQVATGRPIEFDIQDRRVTARQATSLALITNELISNALKHGDGSIRVRFEAQETHSELTVSDEGPGFPDNFDVRRSANTGLQLVEHLVHWDLGGTASYRPLPLGGAQVRVSVPHEAVTR
jgi:PAS domain S-box-containing protein